MVTIYVLNAHCEPNCLYTYNTSIMYPKAVHSRMKKNVHAQLCVSYVLNVRKLTMEKKTKMCS